MRESASKFLLSQTDERISRQAYIDEISVHEFACLRLLSHFRAAFTDRRLSYLLGGVLGDLPELIFEDIRNVNPFFIFIDCLAAVQQLNTNPFEKPVIAPIAKELLDLPDTAVRGGLLHELAHIHLRHHQLNLSDRFGPYSPVEEEADEAAKSWGFTAEIESIRHHLNLRKGGI